MTNYADKYVKYKTKYFYLKNLQSGGKTGFWNKNDKLPVQVDKLPIPIDKMPSIENKKN